MGAEFQPVAWRIGQTTTTERVTRETLARLSRARETHMGYPYNLNFSGQPLATFSRFMINNLGDPYAGSNYGTEVCEMEREVVAWLGELWGAKPSSDYWGAIGASGTEGNFWALYLAREALPDAVLLHSAEAHYSIPKAAKILRMEAQTVDSLPNGAISIDDLARRLGALGGRRVILALTCGTTMKGAHDDIAAAMACLESAGFGPERRFVHVDGALNAVVLPFAREVDPGIMPDFRHGFDSLSTSGHKMIGAPAPCGVLVARRQHVDRVSAANSYLRANDTTLMSSRNGQVVVALWMRLHSHGREGFRKDVDVCIGRAHRLAGSLDALGAPVMLNYHSLTVVFPEPSKEILRSYQLPTHGGLSHAVVMPNVDDALIDRFLRDYADWWTQNGKAETSGNLCCTA